MSDSRDPSRREFLALSALGLIGLSSRNAGLAGAGVLTPDDSLLYVGTYTENTKSEGIYVVRMDRRTGALSVVGSVNAGANPSFLALHPNGRMLYAVNETTERDGKSSGGVSAFSIRKTTGSLTKMGEQASEGGAPCYVSVERHGRSVLVANYVGGNVSVLPILANGSIGPATHVSQHRGMGPNKERQEGPHAHCILPDASTPFALSADLGIDRVLVYRIEANGKTLREVPSSDAVLQPGSGPRHLAFHPRLPIVYVSNELASTVTALHFDRETGALRPIETHSTLPAGWKGANFPADIHVSSSGNALYVSNRGHNSIAVFSVANGTGKLGFLEATPTEGDWPRNFNLDPSGRWLLVANQKSDSIVVLARHAATGRLTTTKQRLDLPSPVCLRFRSQVG